MKPLLLAGLLVLSAAAAFAHATLLATVPADGAVLARAPARIVLTFASPIRLTRVQLHHDDGPAAGLDLTGYKGFGTRFAIALPGRGRGRYRIAWRGLAADGHAMRGGFAFRVR